MRTRETASLSSAAGAGTDQPNAKTDENDT